MLIGKFCTTDQARSQFGIYPFGNYFSTLSIFKYFSIGDGYVHNYQEDLPPHIPVQLYVSILVT